MQERYNTNNNNYTYVSSNYSGSGYAGSNYTGSYSSTSYSGISNSSGGSRGFQTTCSGKLSGIYN